jgi:fumarate reductase subunit D
MPDQQPNTTPPTPDIPEDDKLLAVLSYVPVLCLIPYLRAERSDFVTAHVRLGMALFIIEIFALIMRYLRAIWDVVIFLCMVAAVAGIIHVVKGKSFSVPYLSTLFDRRRSAQEPTEPKRD